MTETGNVNQYVHIWLYEDAADRERKRAAMWADPDWIAYTEKSAELGALVAQENKLMTPVDFFQVKRCGRTPTTAGSGCSTQTARQSTT